MIVTKPAVRPARPSFSSGPCVKRPGWTLDALSDAFIGRSHRAKNGLAKLREVIDRSRAVLGVPDDYRIAIVPGSDTGAVEMALWTLLGERGVDCLAWETFGSTWVTDVESVLRLAGARVMAAHFGCLPDLRQVDWSNDVVFTWNGTTAGVRVPDGDWIADDRAGLSICDATSAAFAMDLPWPKLDVTTWSWQKVLGGEGAHGMIVLSPRAVERLQRFTPAWPIPKVLRLMNKGRLPEDLFAGNTINTPSMLCVEDQIDALRWAESVGGLPALIARSMASLSVLEKWVAASDWVDFLAEAPATRSNTSVCLKIVDPWFCSLPLAEQWRFIQRMCELLDQEQAAHDIAAYRDAPPGLRIWCGATVDTADVAALTPWLDWAYGTLKQGVTA
ncbi:MAG: phosphoserine transaminase [Methyloversatilis sp.]|jgi:phosphoserine aminotransferase|nr:phosphoserine transaminase [Methyloversatilis sp.]MBP6194007.1 phosphoserine transaminase [Methyloversatilis sp.]MBP9118198.1 phosphoserine transaminase [Methyloversatilis sp.]